MHLATYYITYHTVEKAHDRVFILALRAVVASVTKLVVVNAVMDVAPSREGTAELLPAVLRHGTDCDRQKLHVVKYGIIKLIFTIRLLSLKVFSIIINYT